MIADEKSTVRRNRAIVEDGKWRFELRRPAGLADHRQLLRIFHQRPFAVVEGQRYRVERERSRRPETCCKRRHSSALHDLPSVEHSAFSQACLSRLIAIGIRGAIVASATAKSTRAFGV